MLTLYEHFNTSINNKIIIQTIKETMTKFNNLNIPIIKFDELEKIQNPLVKLNILIEYLEEVYNFHTENYKSSCDTNKPYLNSLELLNNTIEKNNKIISDAHSTTDTLYEEIENIKYTIDKHNFFINAIKLVLYISLGLLLLPLLGILGFLSKYTILILWFIGVICLGSYLVYKLYYKELNRDNKFFNKFDFDKPKQTRNRVK